MVVDLSIHCHADPTRRIPHGLLAAAWIGNRQTLHSEATLIKSRFSRFVRTAGSLRARHRR
jgi:hypothetical protein